MNKLFKNRSGQNTVEYLLMLAAVVAVAILVGGLLKNYLGEAEGGLMKKIKDMIDNAVTQLK